MPSTAEQTFAAINSVAPPEGQPSRAGTVVVLGGSVAGMLTARVLSDHADTVLLIERDDSLSSILPRYGVPQGSQAHLLLPAALRQIERWFPSFGDDAVANGAVMSGADQRGFYIDGMLRAKGVATDMLGATRPFLERLLRARLSELPNVTTVNGRATGITFDDTRATGVEYEAGGARIRQSADLVVDAMGRSSRAADWLAAAGWPPPPLTRHAAAINYATLMLRRRPDNSELRSVMSLTTSRVGGDFGAAFYSAVEQDRWILTMAGFGESRPGEDLEDMVRRCRSELPSLFASLPFDDVVSPIMTYRLADSRRRRYDELARLPGGLISVGDAVASFNPIYGQGISSAALQASCLSRYLHSGVEVDAPAHAFYRLQRVVVDAAWGVSTRGDLSRPSVRGPHQPGDRMVRWVADRILAATLSDPAVARRFEEVSYMLRHPDALRRPEVLLRSLRARRPRR